MDDAAPMTDPTSAGPPGRPKLALCMIVRDESHVIRRCIESVRDLVDSWIICDTGSTDGTPELIHELLGDLPGELFHTRWVDFGHNRSELMALAHGRADRLLLLDADMTVEQVAPLPELTADAYLLRHVGDLDYGVLRLVDGDRRWWYEGSTHEYLCTDGRVVDAPLPALQVVHHADGSSRDTKLLRDLALLRRDVARGTDSPRTAFYLAQTYRDLGRRDSALEWYRRRVDLGGWDEEVFYAALQAGVLLRDEGIAVAAGALLDAWQRRPTRAEPLYELARAYREHGSFDLAHLFAERGLQLEYPSDVLFVHRWVYSWGLLVERSMAAAALGRYTEAAEDLRSVLALEELGELDDEVVEFAERRLSELDELIGGPSAGSLGGVPRLAGVAPSTRIGQVTLDVRPAWPAFNPSIVADGDGFRAVVRTANYRIQDGVAHDDGVLRNVNYLVSLDDGLGIRGVEPMREAVSDLRVYDSRIHGYEDCRLIRLGDRWFATATSCELNPIERREIVLLELDGPDVVSVRQLHGPNPGRHEKNWMPFVADGELRLLYSCVPTVVLRCDVDSGETEVLHRSDGPAGLEHLRGGSQGVALDRGGWCFVVHEVDRSGGRPRYLHRFLELSPELEVVAVSAPFTFAGDPVEFCAGMARHGSDLVLSFGISDAAAGLAVVGVDEVDQLLQDPPVGGSPVSTITVSAGRDTP